MRPATYEPEQIIEAGLALQAEGRNITGFALRNQVGGGNPTRLRQIWDEYQASQSTVVTEPVAELPVEVAEEVKAVSAALSERITQLATELNDKRSGLQNAGLRKSRVLPVNRPHRQSGSWPTPRRQSTTWKKNWMNCRTDMTV